MFAIYHEDPFISQKHICLANIGSQNSYYIDSDGNQCVSLFLATGVTPTRKLTHAGYLDNVPT